MLNPVKNALATSVHRLLWVAVCCRARGHRAGAVMPGRDHPRGAGSPVECRGLARRRRDRGGDRRRRPGLAHDRGACLRDPR